MDVMDASLQNLSALSCISQFTSLIQLDLMFR